MFDLEKSIADWRKQMLAAGIQTPVPLEELEIHLREEIERQTKSGLGVAEAFEIAAKKIGQGKVLKHEFKKISGIFENGVMKQFKPVIYVAGTHYLLWWVLWAALELPRFGFHLLFEGNYFGGKPDPILYDLSEWLFLPFYVLNLPMMRLYSDNWLLNVLFGLPLNSLIWGVIFGGIWIAVRQKFNRCVVSRS